MSSAWVSGIDSNFGNQLTGHLTIERQEIIAEGFGPTFCCSASSKINGAFYLINSVKKLRSSVVNPSTLNLLTAGRWFNVVNTKINRAFDSYANGSVFSCL